MRTLNAQFSRIVRADGGRFYSRVKVNQRTNATRVQLAASRLRAVSPPTSAADGGSHPPSSHPMLTPDSDAYPVLSLVDGGPAQSSTQVTATGHGFQGGFRLSAAGDNELKATSAQYRLADIPNLVGDGVARLTGASMPCASRRVVTNELLTILGAFFGFIAVTWPLVGAAADAPAPWSYKPTAISGMGALLLGSELGVSTILFV